MYRNNPFLLTTEFKDLIERDEEGDPPLPSKRIIRTVLDENSVSWSRGSQRDVQQRNPEASGQSVVESGRRREGSTVIPADTEGTRAESRVVLLMKQLGQARRLWNKYS